VNDVAPRADGAAVATAGSDGTVRLWRADRLEEAACLERGAGDVGSVAWCLGGAAIATASLDGTLTAWRASPLPDRAAMREHERTVVALAASANGERYATTSLDGTVRVWEPGRPSLATLPAGSEVPWAVSLDAAGTRVAFGGDDGVLWVHDVETGAVVARFSGNERDVLAVALSRDGKRAVTAGQDGTVRVWDLVAGVERAKRTFRPFPAGAALTPDGGTVVASVSTIGTLLLDAETLADVASLPGASPVGGPVALSASGGHAGVAARAGAVFVWDLGARRLLHRLDVSPDTPEDLAFSPDGERVAVAFEGGSLRVWDVWTGRLEAVLSGADAPRAPLAFSADGRTLLGLSATSAEVRTWDLAPLDDPAGTVLAGVEARCGFVLDGFSAVPRVPERFLPSPEGR
jgi:WD40 repeat protein